jgi:hypothetical protein
LVHSAVPSFLNAQLTRSSVDRAGGGAKLVLALVIVIFLPASARPASADRE